jgi:hypothetical protein
MSYMYIPNGSGPAQTQPGQTPGQTAPLPAQTGAPLAATPQDYAAALARLSQQAQTGLRTPGALASSLGADALLRYAQGLAQQKAAQAPPAGSPTAGGGQTAIQLPSGALPIGQPGPQQAPGAFSPWGHP